MDSCLHENKNNQNNEGDVNRRIKANSKEYNSKFKYSDNYISTSKYSFFTFVPKNLFEQFQRIANAYFLVLLILQLIPQISSLNPYTTIIPLIAVLTISAIKDAVDDWQRHSCDNKVNNRLTWVLRDGGLVEDRWHKISVGDIIKLENNQFVSADVMILSSSEPNSLCYLETAELDGETNLKVRQALEVTDAISDDVVGLSNFNGDIECNPPNNNLGSFEGVLTYNDEQYPITSNNILLRGCILRNTGWCFGLVIYTGKETKLMMNSGTTTFKRTSIDKLLNVLIIGIFAFLFLICLFCSLGSGLWEYYIGYDFQAFLPWESFIPGSYLSYHPSTTNPTSSFFPTTNSTTSNNSTTNHTFYNHNHTYYNHNHTYYNHTYHNHTDPEHTPVVVLGVFISSLLVFLSYFIVLNTLVPISLYVSVEMIRFGHSWWINWDKEMYYKVNDTPARSRSTTLNEELGQIKYIFSDKTGTLTQNIMAFLKCSINGIKYGYTYDEMKFSKDKSKRVDFSENPFHEPLFKFYDKSLWQQVKQGNAHVHMMFRLLSLCHTVMSESHEDTLEYKAQSPDEGALVSAARNFGFVFKARTINSITIEVMGRTEVHDLLAILDFNNVRKRMSVILKKDNRITLYCKGADSTVFELLDQKKSANVIKTTNEHLTMFAQNGLRTLVCGFKEISISDYNEWAKSFKEASVSMEDREEKLTKVYEEIEKDMVLIGATAIEDKLQDGVPQTITNLMRADIKFWLLTGDKIETAINIGYSSGLLKDELQDIFIIDKNTREEVEKELISSLKQVENFNENQNTIHPTLSVNNKNIASGGSVFGGRVGGYSGSSREDSDMDTFAAGSGGNKRGGSSVSKDGGGSKGGGSGGRRQNSHSNNKSVQRYNSTIINNPSLDDTANDVSFRSVSVNRRRNNSLIKRLKHFRQRLGRSRDGVDDDGDDDDDDKKNNNNKNNDDDVGEKNHLFSQNITYQSNNINNNTNNKMNTNNNNNINNEENTIISINKACNNNTKNNNTSNDIGSNKNKKFLSYATTISNIPTDTLQPPWETVSTVSSQHTTNLDKSKSSVEMVDLQLMEEKAMRGSFALVISGSSLLYALDKDLEDTFCRLGCLCSAVICCRVTPLQKALVVELVKRKKETITLAIGDGANDVSMIRRAHIGVGLSGQEGMQAVLASDFSLAQFKYLERLLLVHGRWSYLRMCKFLKYFFYKNFAFTFCHVWYAFFCGFSAQTLYDEAFISLYNICYTSLPILALGIFEKDVNDDYSIAFPTLYTSGHMDLFFNKKKFAICVMEGVLSSLVLFFVPFFSFNNAVKPNGQDLSGHKAFGTIVASSLIVTVTFRCALDTWFWTGFNHFVIWGSIVFYFAFTSIFYSEIFDYTYLGTSENVMGSMNFFFTLLLVVTSLLLPVVAVRFYFLLTAPNLTDVARLKQRETKIKKVRRFRPRLTKRLPNKLRTGYAWSHQEGYGNIIMNGLFIPQIIHTTSGVMTDAFKSLAIPSAAVLGIPIKKKTQSGEDDVGNDVSSKKKMSFKKNSQGKPVRVPSRYDATKSVSDEDVGCRCGRYLFCTSCMKQKKTSLIGSLLNRRMSRREDSLEELNTLQNFYGYFGSVQPQFHSSIVKADRVKSVKFETKTHSQDDSVKTSSKKEELKNEYEKGVRNDESKKGDESDGANVNENSLLVGGEEEMRRWIEAGQPKEKGGKRFWKKKGKKSKEVRIFIPGESTTTTTLITPIKKSPVSPANLSTTQVSIHSSIQSPIFLPPTNTNPPTKTSSPSTSKSSLRPDTN